jgi:hypothetical protein
LSSIINRIKKAKNKIIKKRHLKLTVNVVACGDPKVDCRVPVENQIAHGEQAKQAENVGPAKHFFLLLIF